MIPSTHTHPKNCPDRASAAGDRKRHEAAQKEREAAQQVLAHNEWFSWYPPRKDK